MFRDGYFWHALVQVQKGGCRANQTANLGHIPMIHPSCSNCTCVYVLRATVSCCHTFVPGVMGKYNPNTWSEKGSDTVGCHYHLNQSSFTVEPGTAGFCCRKKDWNDLVMISNDDARS